MTRVHLISVTGISSVSNIDTKGLRNICSNRGVKSQHYFQCMEEEPESIVLHLASLIWEEKQFLFLFFSIIVPFPPHRSVGGHNATNLIDTLNVFPWNTFWACQALCGCGPLSADKWRRRVWPGWAVIVFQHAFGETPFHETHLPAAQPCLPLSLSLGNCFVSI